MPQRSAEGVAGPAARAESRAESPAESRAEFPAESPRGAHRRGASRRARHLGWSAVGVLGELCVTVGLLLFLFVAYQLWWTDVEAARTSSQTVSALRAEFERGQGTDPLAAEGVIEGKAFALLHVPRLGGDWVWPVMEGTDLDILSGGVGHYPQSARPGEVGNFAIAGHRTTWGRPFHDIETLAEGDVIVVETTTQWQVYAVTSHEIVSPWDTEVLAPVPGQPTATPTERMLTITTCHPKFSAAQRYVVHAQLRETRTREEGLPSSILQAPPPAPAGDS